MMHTQLEPSSGQLSRAAQDLQRAAEALQRQQPDQPLTTKDIRDRAANGLYPSDYCYNRLNKDAKFTPMFEQVAPGQYLYLGLGFRYNGPVRCKQQGQPDRVIGQWTDGRLTLREDPRLMPPADHPVHEPTPLPSAVEAGQILQLFTQLDLANQNLASDSLTQADQSLATDEWKHAISDLRCLLECVLREVAAAHSLSNGAQLPEATYISAAAIRKYLEAEGVLTPAEAGNLKAVYGLLSGLGPHPGDPDEDQAHLARTLALTWSQYVLRRFQNFLGG